MASSRSRASVLAKRGPAPGSGSRRVAIDALLRIERGGAYANLVLPELLNRSDLGPEDRHFVTEMVYGTTRMRRSCDHLVDRFLLDTVEPEVRAALRLGAYQLAFLDTPAHAALDATVGAVKGRGRSVVNAVLRRVASAPVEYPDRATELSYPDWIVERLIKDLGDERALRALEAMNQGVRATVRADGYVQDAASQAVVAAVEAQAGELVFDLCAAPGGKATGIAASGARTVALDLRPKRAGLISKNVKRLDLQLPVVVADGTNPPFAPASADRVLVDAPCSGLGSLRSRADARWRIDADAPERLARLQVGLVRSGLELLKPGGTLVYSVCTLTSDEGRGVLDVVRNDEGITVLDGPEGAWDTDEGLSIMLPTAPDAHDADTHDADAHDRDGAGAGVVNDAMMLFRLRRG